MKRLTALSLCVLMLLSVFSFCASAAPDLGKPQNLTAKVVDGGTVVLNWSAVTNAAGYRIYQKTSSGWKAIKNTTATTFKITNLRSLNTYTFAVRVGAVVNDKVIFSQTYSTVTVKTSALKAATLNGTPGLGRVTLSWNYIPGTEGYCVYQHIGGKWKRVLVIEKATKTSCVIKELEAKKNHYFAVRAYCYVSGKVNYGPVSNYLKIVTLDPNKVTAKCTAVSENAAKIQWTKAPDATGYGVYVYLDGAWKLVKNITSQKTLSYVVKGLKSDSVYYFCVLAYKKTGSSITKFTPSDKCKAVTNPSIVDLSKNYTDTLKAFFQSESYTFSYKTYDANYGYIPVTVKKSGEDYILISSVNEMKYRLVNTDEGLFIVLDEKEAYVKVPDVLAPFMSIEKTMEDFIPDDSWKKSASIEAFGSSMSVCEVYTSPITGQMLKFYYKAGTLIGIDDLNRKGEGERAYITQISTSCDGDGFTIPSDYTRIFSTFAIDELLEFFK
ncbi:MAG: fibronectin type III domain-containing protein [Acutalibacteraceae bacterium]